MSGIATASAAVYYTATSTLNLASATVSLWERTGLKNYCTSFGMGGFGLFVSYLSCNKETIRTFIVVANCFWWFAF